MIYFELHSHDMYTKKHRFGSLEVIDGGLIQTREGWRHKKRFLEHYELLFVSKGILHLWISGKELSFRENQLLILPPYQTLEGSKTSIDEVSFFWVDFITDIAEALPLPALFQPQSIRQPDKILPLLTMLLETISVSSEKSDILSSVMMVILYAAKRDQSVELPSKAIANDILSFIEAHLYEQLTTQAVAEALNYNKDYISRIVSKTTGMPLKKYINRRKMEIARTLLHTSTYCVEEISDLLGFRDSNLFTKFFIYHQNTSPTSYRLGTE